jgi:predicted DNA binding CopG/RHH family protein
MSKKSFKDSISNPAMSFISQESIDKVEAEVPAAEEVKFQRPAKPPKGYKINPLYIETKSKRLQLLIQPSLHEKLKSKAQAEGISVNELINCILQDALAEE